MSDKTPADQILNGDDIIDVLRAQKAEKVSEAIKIDTVLGPIFINASVRLGKDAEGFPVRFEVKTKSGTATADLGLNDVDKLIRSFTAIKKSLKRAQADAISLARSRPKSERLRRIP